MSRSALFLPPQGHFLRPRLRLARPARRIAWFGLTIFFVAILCFRIGGISADALFAGLALSCALLVVALLIALFGLAKAWFLAARGGSAALGAAVVAAIGLVPFAYAALLAAEHPATNRAYTIGLVQPVGDGPGLKSPPATEAADVATLTSALAARRYAAPPIVVTEAVQTALSDVGWTVEDIVAVDPAGDTAAEDDPLGIITNSGVAPLPTPRDSVQDSQTGGQFDLPARDIYLARATTSDWLLGLESDVTIQVEAEEDSATVVDIRSVSRDTPVDLGQNRRFIESFYEALDLVMSGEEDV
ncbi:DUF1499 domain-containing protein [Fulvimarina sp. 2208YS6-2-32]|uniref:DUF1499 domain-containing protein n=1 Tax=Fulvimarina uroteuthidis TaxID=3098149 RepID=A0ABU5I3N1_9HYPH|nr:DUF1499 domain-containing protein [Fulvimarina sp. 2208YS6-2-32]MDY8109979.1 DUF1499 domain-containing protein [Fulvimarina sp. 2208YS6-2-32]